MAQTPRQDQNWDDFLSDLDELCSTPEPAPVKQKQTARAKQKKKSSSRKGLLLPVIILLAALIVLAGLLFALLKPQQAVSDTVSSTAAVLPEGVTAGGLTIGGMTEKAAAAALNKAIAGSMTIDLGSGRTLELPEKTLSAKLDTGRLIRDAMEAGGSLALADYLTLDESAVRSMLECSLTDSGTVLPSAGPAGALPELSTDRFDPSRSLPDMTVTIGSGGVTPDLDGIYSRVFTALAGLQHQAAAADLLLTDASELPDAQELLEKYAVAPVNDTLDPDTGTVIPGSWGVTFDADALARAMENASAGSTVFVPMTAVRPDVTGEEVYFQDLLGYTMSPHNTNEKRNVNLGLACKAINGVVLQPGETFSYNDTVGPRTEEAGFQSAPVYSGTSLVPDIGGGVCQVSSTLYLCTLFAGLETVERVNHGLPVNYLPLGLDATVSYGVVDLKFTNPYDYPIRIMAEYDEEFVRVWIMGTETRDYYVKMRYSAGGNYAVAREVHYDRETGRQLDTEQEIKAREPIRSGYLEELISLMGEIGSGDAYINTNIRPQGDRLPSEETMEAARENKAPNAFAAAED